MCYICCLDSGPDRSFNRSNELRERFLQVGQLIDAFMAFDRACGGDGFPAWQVCLGLANPFMHAWSLKQQFMSLVERSLTNRMRTANHMKLDAIEYFAGSGSSTKSLLHNCLVSHGLALWLDALASGALIWFGTQCSSFSALCRAQSERSASNDCRGKLAPFVVEGNCLGKETALMRILAWLMTCACILKQPLGSLLPQLPCMKRVLQFTESLKITTYLGAYGAPICKPLQFHSTHPTFSALTRPKPTWMLESLAGRKGGQFTGKNDALFKSQSSVFRQLTTRGS